MPTTPARHPDSPPAPEPLLRLTRAHSSGRDTTAAASIAEEEHAGVQEMGQQRHVEEAASPPVLQTRPERDPEPDHPNVSGGHDDVDDDVDRVAAGMREVSCSPRQVPAVKMPPACTASSAVPGETGGLVSRQRDDVPAPPPPSPVDDLGPPAMMDQGDCAFAATREFQPTSPSTAPAVGRNSTSTIANTATSDNEAPWNQHPADGRLYYEEGEPVLRGPAMTVEQHEALVEFHHVCLPPGWPKRPRGPPPSRSPSRMGVPPRFDCIVRQALAAALIAERTRSELRSRHLAAATRRVRRGRVLRGHAVPAQERAALDQWRDVPEYMDRPQRPSPVTYESDVSTETDDSDDELPAPPAHFRRIRHFRRSASRSGRPLIQLREADEVAQTQQQQQQRRRQARSRGERVMRRSARGARGERQDGGR